VLPDTVNLKDAAALAREVAAAQPDAVLHLAAIAFVPESFQNPRETYEVNFFGTFNLLEALRAISFRGKFLYVSSGDVYGLVSEKALPVREDHPLRPRNPYSVSKAAAEALCYQYGETSGFDVMIARPFNHIGPHQSERFVISDFAKQIVEIKLGRRPPIVTVGDINVTRDFSDVRDVVRAYFALLGSRERGETFNICANQEHHIGDVLRTMLAIAGVKAEIRQAGNRLRPSEQKRMRGLNEKLRSATGWERGITFEESLRDIIRSWETELVNA
jgi:GDP-4-dehydro-6-deoxy-D-mannose reductase